MDLDVDCDIYLPALNGIVDEPWQSVGTRELHDYAFRWHQSAMGRLGERPRRALMLKVDETLAWLARIGSSSPSSSYPVVILEKLQYRVAYYITVTELSGRTLG